MQDIFRLEVDFIRLFFVLSNWNEYDQKQQASHRDKRIRKFRREKKRIPIEVSDTNNEKRCEGMGQHACNIHSFQHKHTCDFLHIIERREQETNNLVIKVSFERI